ncbi:MAG: hypothetical protein WC451_05400 [Patescibacteria group bacterium]|jgi:hypothetical protein
MKDDAEKKWEEAHLNMWQADLPRIQLFFKRFGIEIEAVYHSLFSLDYDYIQPVIYLIGKIEKIMEVCDFLDTLAKNNHDDVDKIKIFQLVSHAEIAINTFSANTASMNKGDLVDAFFEPVKDKLQYTLQLSIDDTKKLSKINQQITSSRILYKLRNEYAHQGNFIGKIFKLETDEKKVSNLFSFDWGIPKAQPIEVCGLTRLTYAQFLNIYFLTFQWHFEDYIKKHS